MSASSLTSKVWATTSGVLLTALLLSGCGSSDQAADNTAPPSISASSASASESPSASSSPETSAASPQSSVVAGEYKPADEHGPAQNVPKPKKPEGMDVETPEAMEKFISYWNQLRNYAIQTGDTNELRKHVALTNKTEIENYDSWSAIYDREGWIVGGIRKVTYQPSIVQSLGDGKYIVPVNYQNSDAIVVLDGEFTAHKLTELDGRGYALTVQFADDGSWYMIDEAEVN